MVFLQPAAGFSRKNEPIGREGTAFAESERLSGDFYGTIKMAETEEREGCKDQLIEELVRGGYTDKRIAELLGITVRALSYRHSASLKAGRSKQAEEHIESINELAACGFTQEQIAVVLGMSVDTLASRYADTIKIARLKTIAKAAGHVIRNAISDSNSREARADRYFYLKTQAGWNEKCAEKGQQSASNHGFSVVIKERPLPKKGESSE